MTINEFISTILDGFAVGGVEIPSAWLFYTGHGEPYIVWQQVDAMGSYAGDDDIQGYIAYYDFDVYAKDNYMAIVEALFRLLKANGFTFQPSRTSEDMYEVDTGYYHKTLSFAYLHQAGETPMAVYELNYEIVDSLPSVGTKGTIYLVPNDDTTPNCYDEYIWVNNAFERIGEDDEGITDEEIDNIMEG